MMQIRQIERPGRRFSLSFFRCCNTFRPLVSHPVRAFSWLLLLWLLPLASAFGGQAIVKEIRIEGNRRVEEAAIRAAISEKPGAPYDRKKVNADIQALMKLGLFSDVVVEREGSAGAPILVYRVVEKPSVREARIEGNDKLTNDDLKDVVDIKPYSILDIAAVRRNVKKIQDKYVEKGYYLAEVSHRIEPLPDNQVAIVFTVK